MVPTAPLAMGTRVASAFLETEVEVASEQSKCSGKCQLKSVACGTSWATGLCPGATVCCVAKPAAAATPAAVTPASTTGAAAKVKDPVSLVAGGRSIVLSDLTTEQQSNARLLVRFAKQQGITNTNQVAYILGTALWECHLKPIKEWGGSKKRYAPYFVR